MAKRSSRSVRLRRQTRRRRVKTLLFSLFFLAVAVTAGVLAVTVFFKVSTIQISGKTRYPAAELEKTLGVQQGDNLFLWGQTLGLQRVREKYPYIDTITVHRKLPDTLTFAIQECTPVGALHDGTAWWLIDGKGKLLESVTQQTAQKYITIEGAKAGAQKAGQVLDPKADGATMVLLQMLRALRDNGSLQRVKFINLSRLYQIHMGYDGKYDVWLGTVDSIEHKLKFLNTIIKQKLSPSDVGVIDLSDNNSARFQPESAQEVAAAAKPAAQQAAAQSASKANPSQAGASQSGTTGTSAGTSGAASTTGTSASTGGASQSGNAQNAGNGGTTE